MHEENEPFAVKFCQFLSKSKMYVKLLQPPIQPKIAHAGDTSNFDDYSDDEWADDADEATKQDMDLFQGF